MEDYFTKVLGGVVYCPTCRRANPAGLVCDHKEPEHPKVKTSDRGRFEKARNYSKIVIDIPLHSDTLRVWGKPVYRFLLGAKKLAITRMGLK